MSYRGPFGLDIVALASACLLVAIPSLELVSLLVIAGTTSVFFGCLLSGHLRDCDLFQTLAQYQSLLSLPFHQQLILINQVPADGIRELPAGGSLVQFSLADKNELHRRKCLSFSPSISVSSCGIWSSGSHPVTLKGSLLTC